MWIFDDFGNTSLVQDRAILPFEYRLVKAVRIRVKNADFTILERFALPPLPPLENKSFDLTPFFNRLTRHWKLLRISFSPRGIRLPYKIVRRSTVLYPNRILIVNPLKNLIYINIILDYMWIICILTLQRKSYFSLVHHYLMLPEPTVIQNRGLRTLQELQ